MNAATIGRVPAAIVGTTTKHLSHSNYVPTNYTPCINVKQNKLGIEFLGSHWEQPVMKARDPGFFSFGRGGGGRVMLNFCCCSHKFSICYHHILMNFHFSHAPETCSPKVWEGMGWLHARVMRVTTQAATRYFWDILASPSFSGWRTSELWTNQY
jgi:hypothetical protein